MGAGGADYRSAGGGGDRPIARSSFDAAAPGDAIARAGIPRGGVAVVAGTFVFYFDTVSGRRRRALARDQASRVGHVIGRVPKRIGRRGRFVRGVARGVVHNAPLVSSNGTHAPADEETLVARVKSEIFRDAPVTAGTVNVDAYEGCVTLRGQLPSESDMRRLVAATKKVEGVTEVRSYLHLPDELPPNKAEMYEHSEGHLPAM